jgi:hypothetical protein
MLLTRSLIEEARLQITALEAMFADPGLAELAGRSPHHPAVERYSRLAELVSVGVSYPDELDILQEITASLFDRAVWVQAPRDADYWAFIPHERARNRVRAGIQDAEQFHDTIAEVFFWSWLQERTQNAELVEETGLPDVVIGRGSDGEVWAEVKRIRLGKNPKRVGDVIDKANDALKKARPDRAGLVFLSVERAVQRVALDDRIPNDIEPYIEQVERRLSSDFGRSVGRVVFSWDYFVVESEPGAGITYRFRRRSETREHHAPRLRAGVVIVRP